MEKQQTPLENQLEHKSCYIELLERDKETVERVIATERRVLNSLNRQTAHFSLAQLRAKVKSHISDRASKISK